MFVSAFANSNKAIKGGYDSQIKDYDYQLNGYTKETAYGTQRFFGADEIRQMFKGATPELLRKITASGNVVTSPKHHYKCHLLS